MPWALSVHAATARARRFLRPSGGRQRSWCFLSGMQLSPSTRPLWAPWTRQAQRFSPSSWPQLAPRRLAGAMWKPLRITIASALPWPQIAARASWRAPSSPLTGPCGGRILATRVATSARGGIAGSVKPRPPSTRHTRQPRGLPRPAARAICTSGGNHRTPRIVPVRRRSRSPTHWTGCFPGGGPPAPSARLMAPCAPLQGGVRHARCGLP